MRITIALVAATFAAAPGAALARPQRIEVGGYEYRFDDERITREALEPLLELREDGTLMADGISRDPLDELWLKRRDLSFDQWADWGPPVLARARARLAELEQAVQHLTDLEAPTVLVPARAYVLQNLLYFRDRQAVGLALLERWDLAVLRRKIGPVDPSATCADAIARIEQLGDKMGRFNAFMFDWGNCVNRGRPDRYPAKAWRRFLKKYRIREVARGEDTGD